MTLFRPPAPVSHVLRPPVRLPRREADERRGHDGRTFFARSQPHLRIVYTNNEFWSRGAERHSQRTLFNLTPRGGI
jgi:hypothetical protein